MTHTGLPVSGQRTGLSHHGDPGELFGIYVRNVALGMVTMGVYHFWAKTRVRRYLWGQTSFLDDRFEYAGIGKELFLGALIVTLMLVPAFIAYELVYQVVLANYPEFTAVFDVLLLGLIVPLVGIAKFRARRYRLSRTLWRGIRGAQTGSAIGYGLRFMGSWLLTLLTLGLYWPFMDANLTGYRLNHTWFGDRQVRFDGRGRDLVKPFLVAWLLFLPTLGISAYWYQAAALRYYADHTVYEDLRFASRIEGKPLMWLSVSNALLLLFTLGLAYPYVLMRKVRFYCDNLEAVGEQDFSQIAQSRRVAPTTGEGLAEALDVGEF